jgi:hypothetical protein
LRQGEPGRAGSAAGSRSVEAERPLEVLGRGGALAGLVGVEPEQGAHRDPHRQAAHPVVDVDDLAGAQRSIAGVASAIIASTEATICSRWEGGHHDRPGAVVVVLVDRQQAVAEQRD